MAANHYAWGTLGLVFAGDGERQTTNPAKGYMVMKITYCFVI